MKRCLKKVLKGARLTLDELHTILVEIESILNNRPLTYVDNDDLREPITPNHLSLGHRLTTLDDINTIDDHDEPEQMTGKQARHRLRHKTKVLNDFRKRCYKEYLLELRDNRRSIKRESEQIISVGDVVLIEDDGPRLMWKLGRVVELIVSKDGECRAAGLSVTGSKNILQRPIRKLFPLEFADEYNQQIKAHVPKFDSNKINKMEERVVPLEEVPLQNNDMLYDNDGDSLKTQVPLPNKYTNKSIGNAQTKKGATGNWS